MKKILIVDDNSQNLYLLEVLLRAHDYEVTSALHGAEALEKARGDCPAMIISDILMPVMDGFELCRAWKRDDRLKDVPFVFYTATYTDPRDEEFALDLGAERFIVKPQEPEIFLRTLEEVFEAHTAGRRVARKTPELDEKVYFKEYNEALIRKLEQKMFQLGEANRRLEREIADHKRAEAERLRLQDQLFEAQKLEAIGRLAGGVAHDFNNLLSVIISYSEFALEALQPGDPLHQDLVEILGASRRAAVLTHQLLAFSRKQVLKPEVVDLNGILEGMSGMLKRLLGEDIELSFKPQAASGMVRVDPGQIEQVIMNLAVNARDAMPGGGRLTLETCDVELDDSSASQHVAVTPGPYVMLAVTDMGVGMDEATRAQIFQPFFTTKEKGKGTGLGLAMVYGIVTQSGGTIWVYSEPGHGTTFKIYLPRVPPGEASSPRATAGVSSRPAGSETILVVEDEEMVRSLAERILAAAGYTVLAAANGGEALLACERHPGAIHLLLTDVIMPRMSGQELAARLMAVRPALRVLYMSGYTDNAIVQHSVLEESAQFIAKPITASSLAQKVREVLDRET